MLEIDAPVRRLTNQAADLALDLGRGERQAFVGAPRRHAERVGPAVSQIPKDARSELGERERAYAGRREVRDAEHTAEPGVHLVDHTDGSIGELDLQASHYRANGDTVEVGQDGPD